MKVKPFFCMTFAFLFLSTFSTAQTSMEKYLSTLKVLESEDGRKLDTYEDVDEILIDPFQKRNKEYPYVNEGSIPEGYIKKDNAKKFFDKFSSHAVVGDFEDFREFMTEFLYMPNESETESMESFPVRLGGVLNPCREKYYIFMHEGYNYVSRFSSFSPNALSCRDCPSLCSSKCRRNTSDTLSEGFSGQSRRKHIYGSKNIYSKFKENLFARADVVCGKSIKNKKNFVEINYADRTPPKPYYRKKVFGPARGGLPDMGGDPAVYACTTGDWYLTDEMMAIDNVSEKVEVKFTFGRIGGCPPQGSVWTDYEDWTYPQNTKVLDNGKFVKGEEFTDTIRFFGNLEGVVRYSFFMKEADENSEGNVNPSCKKIIENSPEICYGYKTGGDLGRDPLSAKPWPDKRELSKILQKGYQTANVRIYDNDRPNILIRVTNVETGKKMFFPPCMPAGQFVVNNSSDYNAEAGPDKTNQDDYDLFVGENLPVEYDFTKVYEYPDGIPYYTIYSIINKKSGHVYEEEPYKKFIRNKDIKFINENFTLEDYFFSDKHKIFSSVHKDSAYKHSLANGDFGKRMGTMPGVIALFENSGNFCFEKDVEYKLDVWTDDNVKWSNIEMEYDMNGLPLYTYDDLDGSVSFKPKVLEYAKVYPTGIKSGIIKVNIPDDSENLSEKVKIDINRSINGGIFFKLKKSTVSSYGVEDPNFFEEKGFPSIEVEAEDYAGYTRYIKLFLRVGDKNLNVRTLGSN